VEYNFELVGINAIGMKLYRDGQWHIYALCKWWEEPTDSTAFVFGITEDNTEWANSLFNQ